MNKGWLAGLIGFSLFMGAPEIYAQLSQQEIESAKKQIDAYKKKIESLERQAKRNDQKIDKNYNFLEKVKKRLDVKGYMTAGIGKSDSENGMEMANYEFTNDWSANDTKVGMQMNFELDDKFSVGTQLSSDLGLEQQINMQWAYLNYKATPNFSVRWGRSVAAQYFLADYTFVGFAYPWIRPPLEVYWTPVGATEGIDLFYNTSVFGVATQFQFRTHTFDGKGSGNDLVGMFDIKDAYSAVATFSKGYFTTKIGYSVAKLTPIGEAFIALDEGFNELEAQSGMEISRPIYDNPVDIGYIQFGMEYNDGHWWIISEYTGARIKDDVFLVPSSDAGYLMAGYRFGKFLPHVTFAKKQTTSDFNGIAQHVSDSIETINTGLTSLAGGLIPTYVGLLQDAVQDDDSVPMVNTLLLYKEAGDPVATGLLTSLATLSGLEEINAGNAGSVTTDGFDLALIIAGLEGQAAEILAPGTGNIAQLNIIKAQADAQIVEQKSATLGLRYDMNSQVAIKVEWSHYFDFGGTTGSFSAPDDDPYAREDKINVIGFTVDAIF